MTSQTQNILPEGFARPAAGFSFLTYRSPAGRNYEPYSAMVPAVSEDGERIEALLQSDWAFHHPRGAKVKFTPVTFEQLIGLEGLKLTMLPLHEVSRETHSAGWFAMEPQNTTKAAEYAMNREADRQIGRAQFLAGQGIAAAPNAQAVIDAGNQAMENTGAAWAGYGADADITVNGQTFRPFLPLKTVLQIAYVAQKADVPFVYTQSTRHLSSDKLLIEMTREKLIAEGIAGGSSFFFGYPNRMKLVESRMVEQPLISKEPISGEYDCWQNWAATLSIVLGRDVGRMTQAYAYVRPETLLGLVMPGVEVVKPVTMALPERERRETRTAAAGVTFGKPVAAK